jgi:nucleoside-diphosphate kinase
LLAKINPNQKLKNILKDSSLKKSMPQTKSLTQRTVVIIKPDGVQRAVSGEIITRFERAGLKIIGMKMIWVKQDLVGKHYPDKEDYLRSIGKKTLENYKKYGIDPGEHIGTMDELEIGKIVRKWNMEYLTRGPVIAMILEAPHAVETVRKIVGHTFPQSAIPGTIRSDYAGDSPYLSNTLKRSVKNLIHASGSVEEAEFEIALWFKNHQIHSYKRVDEDLVWG